MLDQKTPKSKNGTNLCDFVHVHNVEVVLGVKTRTHSLRLSGEHSWRCYNWYTTYINGWAGTNKSVRVNFLSREDWFFVQTQFLFVRRKAGKKAQCTLWETREWFSPLDLHLTVNWWQIMSLGRLPPEQSRLSSNGQNVGEQSPPIKAALSYKLFRGKSTEVSI